MSHLLEYLCPLNSVRLIEVLMYLAHCTKWDLEKCLLNGGVCLIACPLQEVLLYNLFCHDLKRCCEEGPWRPRKLGLFSPLLTPLFHEHLRRLFSFLLYAISESCDTIFADQVVYKPWVLSVSSEAFMPITAILIPAADCVHLLH